MPQESAQCSRMYAAFAVHSPCSAHAAQLASASVQRGGASLGGALGAEPPPYLK